MKTQESLMAPFHCGPQKINNNNKKIKIKEQAGETETRPDS